MTIPMNTDAACAQFKMFESFAKSAVNGRTIVEARMDTPGATFTIKPKSKFDFIYFFARGRDSKDTNETVRNIFKASIIKMFGGTDDNDLSCLPDSVREAMKFNDYGQGKPLSARRIRAVTTAINQHVESRAQQLEQRLASQGIILDDNIKDAIRTAVRTCGNDDNVFATLMEDPKGVLFDTAAPTVGTSPLDTLQVMQRVRDLAKDVNMLRSAFNEFVDLNTAEGKALLEAVKTIPIQRDRSPLSETLLDAMVADVKQLRLSERSLFLNLLPGSPTHGSIGEWANNKLDEILGRVFKNHNPLLVTWAQYRRNTSMQIDYKTILGNMIFATLHVDKKTLRVMQGELNGILRHG